MKIIKYIIITTIIYQLLEAVNIKITNSNKIMIIILCVALVYFYDLSTENHENIFENKTNLEDLFKKINKDIKITKVSSITPSDISTVKSNTNSSPQSNINTDTQNTTTKSTTKSIVNSDKKNNKSKKIFIKSPKEASKKTVKEASKKVVKEASKKAVKEASKKVYSDKIKQIKKSIKVLNKILDNTNIKNKKSLNVDESIITRKNNKKERKENNIKYMEMLFNKLKKEDLLTDDDIKKMKNKLNAGIDDVDSIIIKLEKLNSNSMKYSVKDKEYYKSLGSGISKKWSSQYSILDTKNWAVPAYKPPVCVTNMRCKVCPDTTSGYPVNLMEWDESTKVSNTSINKKWANSQDTETNSN